MTEAEWTLKMWRYLDANHEKILIGKERRLWDNTRVDILTDKWAVEVDWARKWAEAIGQSLYYSSVSGKKPGICLLINDMGHDFKHIYRCNVVTAKYDIDVWLVDTLTSIAILPDGGRVSI